MGAKVRQKLGRRSSAKLDLVISSWDLKGEALGLFLRSNGIYKEELEQWRDQIMSALDDGKPVDPGSRKSYEQKIKRLEQELEEAKVIIELQKKVQELLGEEAPSTPKRSDK